MALAWERTAGRRRPSAPSRWWCPLVAEIGWLRFGARGDETWRKQLRNMSGEDQTLSLA